MKKYEAMPLSTLDATEFMHPHAFPEILHLEDPAIQGMVDYTLMGPETVSADASIDDALLEMKQHDRRILLVMDSEHQLMGIITAEEIQGSKPYQIMEEKRVKRGEIHVRSLMIPKHKIAALNLTDVHHAKVGHIIATMNESGQHFILVQETNAHTGKHVIRGVFSASRINKVLGPVVASIGEAHSIVELNKYLDQ